MNNIFETGVSYFHTISTEIPVTAELYDLLTTDRYKEQVMTVRSENDIATKKNLKNKLPSYTPTGVFRNSGSALPLRLNNLICVDIDKGDNLNVEDFEHLKDQLSKVPYIAYCGQSCGGEGYFCIIPIADTHLFKSHFRSLRVDFAAMGITIDESCSDIGRKRFVSYDPEPYINCDAEAYEGLSDEKMQHNSPHTVNSDTTANWYDIAQTNFYIETIEKKKIDITHPYSKWFRIGCAFANAFGEDGREMFHRVSRFYYNYDPAETDKLYDGILNGSSTNPVTIKTFLYYARESRVDKDHWYD